MSDRVRGTQLEDWRPYVRNHLDLSGLLPERQVEIVDEIAQLFSDAEQDLLEQGCEAEEARRLAKTHVATWDGLRAELERTEVRTRQSVPARLADRLDEDGSRRGGRQFVVGLLRDLATGWRTLRRRPTHLATVVLLLALGVGLNAALFSVARAVLLTPLPYQDGARLVAIWQDLENRGVRNYPSAPADLVDYRQLDAFEEVAGFFSFNHSLVGGDGVAVPMRLAQVTTNFGETLGIVPYRGRLFEADDGTPFVPPAAASQGGQAAQGGQAGSGFMFRTVLSYELWRDRFGAREDLVGEVIQFGGGPAEVIGILPPSFRVRMNSETGYGDSPHALVPYQVDWDQAPRTSWFLATIAKLAPGVTLEEARAQLKGVETSWWEDFPVNANAGTRIRAVSLRDDVSAPVRPALLVLIGAAMLVLLVACVNLSGLVLVRVSQRLRELSIRSALGAGRARLIRLLLAEAVVTAVVAGTVAVLVARIALQVLLRQVPEDLPALRTIGVDGRVALLAIGLCLACSLVASLVPALRVTGRSRLARLGSRGVVGAPHASAVLVVVQVALSLVLLVGAGLMGRSLVQLLQADLGFADSGRLVVGTSVPGSRYPQPEQRRVVHENLRLELARLPGVSAVGAVSQLPLGGGSGQGPYGGERELADGDEGDLRQATWVFVDRDYFEVLETPLLDGRVFDAADAERPPNVDPVVIVDTTLAAKTWPDEEAVGKRLYIKNQTPPIWAEVVGVVAAQRHRSPYGEEQEAIYFPGLMNGSRARWILQADVAPETLGPAVRRAVERIDPLITVDHVEPLSAVVSRARAGSRFLTTLIGLFSLLATILALSGLWGLMAQSVRQRRKEFGLRLALGAGRGRVLVGVLGHGVALVGLGLLVGLVTSVPATRLLESELVGVPRIDAASYALALLGFFLVASLACLGPAGRAARLDPVQTLREDE